MIKLAFKWLPSLLIILIAGGVSYYWMQNKPRANRKPPQKVIPLVEVITPEFKDHQLSVYAMGNVVAAQSVNLTSRINGMVISTNPNFIEGGILKKGEEIVRLDPTDYKLVIAQRQSEVEKARFNLKLEQGQQAVAQREFELLGGNLAPKEKELVLRKPHLNAAKAALAATKAALRQSKLDLERTKVISPFDAIVISRNANIGSWVSTFSTGTPLVQLVGTKHFWIDVSLSVDKLRWIAIPAINSKTGAKVKISYETGWGKGVYRYGVIKRLKAEVESEGRMAKLIVE
ncbi:MAG: efflux RND transporter periplasmic adaptor subunit, partial [Methylococcaceae bacterium]|nr:efflux RND transporter periplasmic adaptor subunit [Methylococcaceae bacterium]